MQRFLRWFALIASVVAVALLLVLPLYGGVVSRETTGETAQSRVSGTLVAANGFSVLFVLAIPVLAAVNAVLPWPAPYRRGADVLGAVVSSVFSVLGAMSIGVFFLPTALALLSVALWPRAARPAT